MKLLKRCWYCLMAAFLLAGLITGRREFFLLLFIMGFVLIFSLCLNIWTARSFCYLQNVEKKECVKGGKTHMRVTITNDKPFPFPLMRLTIVPVARSQRARERFSLLPGSSITFTVPIDCPYRGVHGVGITTLEINDSFGLLKTTFNMLELPYYRHIEMKIYPKLTELGMLPAGTSDSKHIGSVNVWQMEQGESYAGLRPYKPGDPLKRVHRAVSARRREWYVKTYDLPLETSILIALDTTVNCDSEEECLFLSDLTCECAASIARYTLKTGYRVIYRDVGLVSGLILESVKDFPRLYNRLAELNFNGLAEPGVGTGSGRAGGFPQFTAAQLQSAQSIYIISARGINGIQEALSSFEALNTARFDVKLIVAEPGASDSQGAQPRFSAIPGVQTIAVVVGDDVAAVLA